MMPYAMAQRALAKPYSAAHPASALQAAADGCCETGKSVAMQEEIRMAKKEAGLQELMVDQLRDLLDAEKQLVRALPKTAKGASSKELANAFREHLEITKQQVQRLESIFESMGMKAKGKPCKGMKGIVEEGSEIMQEAMEPGVLDTALATAGRKVEHYEMIGYEAARAVAMQLGQREAAGLLEATLKEETAFDRTLAQLSRQLLKHAATGAEDREESGKRGASRKRSGGQRGGSAEPLTDQPLTDPPPGR